MSHRQNVAVIHRGTHLYIDKSFLLSFNSFMFLNLNLINRNLKICFIFVRIRIFLLVCFAAGQIESSMQRLITNFK